MLLVLLVVFLAVDSLIRLLLLLTLSSVICRLTLPSTRASHLVLEFYSRSKEREASLGVGCLPFLVTVLRGACKFGFYEFFKKYYTDLAGPENAAKYKTLIYLAGSASAEVIADIALCPFEAVKVRVQTQPGFARGLSDGLPKFVKAEGALGLYKGYRSSLGSPDTIYNDEVCIF
ncbi:MITOCHONDRIAL PHOSPHATE CARRIER PROTEIN 3 MITOCHONDRIAL-LIKE [Salix purpurea]|uniref:MITOCHONDRIAL PHOSPHATE CARRIER PROTEIN 3 MITOCHONDRIAL-LIKE n=1 Tax=Salix purpurea TaxID=77065 RepID=A0A9Q0VTR6_SALPP|nr:MITOCHONDRIAL PHOSPHATE CARRIER PROTEIN 3 MITOCHONDRIAL-LIKE [Salix purpurea]